MNASDAWALDGLTTHVRLQPFTRRFSQRLAHVSLNLDRIEESVRGLRLFSYNKPNLYAFYDKDHGDRTGAPLRPWAESMLARAGVRLEGGTIEIACFPRMLGTVFNPISVYTGRGPDGEPRGFIYEVNNTFGETHAYVAPAGAGPAHRHVAAKRFHVSPFMDVEGEYRFSMQTPAERFRLVVENWEGASRLHVATLLARRRPLTDTWLAATAFRLPLLTAQVLGGIHWHALHIWRRGAGYRDKPAPPLERETTAQPTLSLPLETH
jgi:uncharacterized protein